MKPNHVVTYDGLPASAGAAHSLRTRKPRAAYEHVSRFVDGNTSPISFAEVGFRIWSGGPEDVTARLVSRTEEALGGPRRRDRTHTEWAVGADVLEAMLDLLGDAGTDARTGHGHSLAAVTWSAPVRLIDSTTGGVYEGIDADTFGMFPVDGYGRMLGESGVRATIGTASSSLSLWLNFPADERLAVAAAQVQENLPFRLSTKHWRTWQPTRDGRGYRSTRIPAPL
ncbi:hypothetical protein [Rhodococcus gannanensis]|uniref:Uncharacterized protein n=1 Tax=Rhodococcus gannanensis TaxID=1960308 RepID=A0ABW4P490_9NOCA